MWSAIKAEVGWASVAAVTRRVGRSLVDEIESLEAELDVLREIFVDYQARNDERVAALEGTISFAQLQSPARDLLERNLAMLLDNIRRCGSESGAARSARDRELLAYLASRKRPARSAGGMRPSTDFDDLADAAPACVRPTSAPLRVRGNNGAIVDPDEPALVRAAVELTDRYVGSASSDERGATAARMCRALEREKLRLGREVERIQAALEEEHTFVQTKSAEATARPPSMKELREFEAHVEREWVRLDALTLTPGAGGALAAAVGRRRPHRASKATGALRAEGARHELGESAVSPVAAAPAGGGRRRSRSLASRIRGEITESRYLF